MTSVARMLLRCQECFAQGRTLLDPEVYGSGIVGLVGKCPDCGGRAGGIVKITEE